MESKGLILGIFMITLVVLFFMLFPTLHLINKIRDPQIVEDTIIFRE